MKPQSIELPLFDDFHAHLRQDELLKLVVRDTNRGGFGRVLAMPNRIPPIKTGVDCRGYAKEIREAEAEFTPLMVGYLTPETTPDTVRGLRQAGAIAIKFYPVSRKGVAGTTNAGYGLTIAQLLDEVRREVLITVAEERLVLCLHGEDPDFDHAEREHVFLPHLITLAKRHPDLRMILEHVSTRSGLEVVEMLPNVAATITVHHLLLTEDDIPGNADYDCLPRAKTPRDRQALIRAAMSGKPRLFLGTDSAPHPRSRKLATPHAFGIYTAPVAVPILVGMFEKAGRLPELEDFACTNGANFYGLALQTKRMEVVREHWIVKPHDDPDAPLPFLANQELEWKIRHASL